MTIAEAQKEIRTVFLGGFMGQLVSGFLWLGSAAFATWGSPRQAVVLLVGGGFFIFPLTQLGLKAIGHDGRVSRDNALNGLGMQVAFVLPLCLPVVGAATLYKLTWFYPAFMVVLGAHYLPFVFLYGMQLFMFLSGILVAGGLMLGMYWSESFSPGAWGTGVILLVFAVLGRAVVKREGAIATGT